MTPRLMSLSRKEKSHLPELSEIKKDSDFFFLKGGYFGFLAVLEMRRTSVAHLTVMTS